MGVLLSEQLFFLLLVIVYLEKECLTSFCLSQLGHVKVTLNTLMEAGKN